MNGILKNIDKRRFRFVPYLCTEKRNKDIIKIYQDENNKLEV